MAFNDDDFNGMLILDSKANVVWYYLGAQDNVGAIAQKANGNLVHVVTRVGISEITPLGVEASKLDIRCESPATSRGGWHHESILLPGDKVLLMGREVHDVTEILGEDQALQASDTIEEWDQDIGESQVLFDIFDFIPLSDRTAASDRMSTRARDDCSDQEFEDVSDWTHGNSLFVAPRGNIIMSMRHLDQIISIAPDYQAIEWRLGGPGGQFDFPTPGDRFYHQHSAVELSNGNILLFDNGNDRPSEEGGEYSRALELELDTANMTATKVWEYRHTPDLFASCCSNVTRLPNGNTVGAFGRTVRTIVEADSEGNTIAVITMVREEGKPSLYRAQPINSISGEFEPPPPSTPTPTPTATLKPGVVTPTTTAVPPPAGDVAPGSGLLFGLLMFAALLIGIGGYYLRQGTQR